MLIGGIEAGGTKFICGIGDELGNILNKISIPTTTPEETMCKVIDYFYDKPIVSLGVGSFGPIDPIQNSPTYGFITNTPKKGWKGFNLLKAIEKIGVPIKFDTDVNAAALAEYLWGAGMGLNNIVYLTIGTGVGGGAILNGQTLQGMLHPEMGHMRVKRLEEDNFAGVCPYHQDCLEGLVSGPAILKRTGTAAQNLPIDHASWKITAYYLAQGIANIMLILSPQKIILGGGVMQQSHLFPMIYNYLGVILNGYVDHANIQQFDTYIVAPGLRNDSGLKGSIALGITANKSCLK